MASNIMREDLEKKSESINDIIVVGSGVAAWSAALALVKLVPNLAITVIEINKIVEEFDLLSHSLPLMRQFHRRLGITEKEFIREVGASFSLGGRYNGWGDKPNTHFFIPFSDHGFTLHGVEFSDICYRFKSAGDDINYCDYSLASQAANKGLFRHPSKEKKSIFSSIEYAYLFDVSKYTQFLKQKALDAGVNVKCVDSLMPQYDSSSGRLYELNSSSVKEPITADFYIDCSGADKILFANQSAPPKKTLESFGLSKYNVVCRSASEQAAKPYVDMSFMHDGWVKQISVLDYTQSCYYFDNKISAEEFIEPLSSDENKYAIKPEDELFMVPPWAKNCLVISAGGFNLGEGFVPQIHLVQSAVLRLIDLFPNTHNLSVAASEYNRLTQLELEHIYDFNTLQQLMRSPFKKAFLNGTLPSITDRLRRKMQLYQSRGKLAFYEGETMTSDNWLTFFIGNNLWPKEYYPLADHLDGIWIREQLQKMASTFDKASDTIPPLKEYLENYLLK